MKVTLRHSNSRLSPSLNANSSKINSNFSGGVGTGADGVDGATFIPNVSEEGIISWTNESGLPNPEPRDISGRPGQDGFSPVVSLSKSGKVTTLEITDKNGTQRAEILDGEGGQGGGGGGVTSWNDLTDRPFYEEEGLIVTILEECEITIPEHSIFAELPITHSFEDGETYIVTFQGVEYNCVARWRSDNRCLLIGNGAILDEDGGNGEPFLIDVYDDNEGLYTEAFLNISEEGPTTRNIEIKHKNITIHHLDKRYLPESVAFDDEVEKRAQEIEQNVNDRIQKLSNRINEVAEATTSWNDLTDKPFGEEEVWFEIWEETTAEFDSPKYKIMPTPSVDFNEGDKCRYTFNGVMYETQIIQKTLSSGSYQKMGGNYYIRDTSIPNNGQPIVFWYYSPNKTYFVESRTSGTHTFFIEKLTYETNKLDEKFLPDSAVLESELTMKGYQTKEQVTTLINDALGVIENGTY